MHVQVHVTVIDTKLEGTIVDTASELSIVNRKSDAVDASFLFPSQSSGSLSEGATASHLICRGYFM